MLELFAQGFQSIMNFQCLMLIAAGTAIGIVFGAIPGLTGTMAVSLCLSMTFGMPTAAGFSLLLSLYIGGISGGLISAILIKIPGTPSSIATTFDGHPMAMRGEAGKALGIGIFYSFLGGMLSILVLIFLSPLIARLAIKFGPYEYFAVGIFSISMISSLIGKNPLKGLASGVLGMCFAMVGSAPIDAVRRYTYDLPQLSGGFALLPVMIGLFAVSEIMKTAEDGLESVETGKIMDYRIRGFGFSVKDFMGQIPNFLRSSAIGMGIGFLPGIGGGTANLIAYSVAKNQSKTPEMYGTGVIDGIVASEASNNASVGGAMIPLLTLGIPGDTVTAILLGGLILHGITPGPLLFSTKADLVYSIFAILIVANFAMLAIEFWGMRVFVNILKVKKQYLLPIIIVLCAVGAFANNHRVFDVWVLLVFGIIGFAMEKNGFSLTPFIMGFILCPIIEEYFRKGVSYSRGSYLPFITRPISGIFIALAVFTFVYTLIKMLRTNARQAKE